MTCLAYPSPWIFLTFFSFQLIMIKSWTLLICTKYSISWIDLKLKEDFPNIRQIRTFKKAYFLVITDESKPSLLEWTIYSLDLAQSILFCLICEIPALLGSYSQSKSFISTKDIFFVKILMKRSGLDSKPAIFIRYLDSSLILPWFQILQLEAKRNTFHLLDIKV